MQLTKFSKLLVTEGLLQKGISQCWGISAAGITSRGSSAQEENCTLLCRRAQRALGLLTTYGIRWWTNSHICKPAAGVSFCQIWHNSSKLDIHQLWLGGCIAQISLWLVWCCLSPPNPLWDGCSHHNQTHPSHLPPVVIAWAGLS